MMMIPRAVGLSCKFIGKGYVRERLKSSLMKFYGVTKHYEVPLSRILYDITGHDNIQWHLLLIRYFTELWPCYCPGPYYRFWRYYLIPKGFHRTFATGAVCQHRTLTAPDTWSCPIWDLHLFLCWDHSFLNLSCLRTFWVSNIPRYFYFALHVIRDN